MLSDWELWACASQAREQHEDRALVHIAERKRWSALTRFLADGWLEIDNNIAERALRSVAVGRKNWLFAGSKAGGECAATLYTIMETAKLNGIDPQAHIREITEKIARDWPASRWDELMPWNWQPPAPSLAQAA